MTANNELPDNGESRIWGVLAAENAERLLDSAGLLATNGRLGHAIGLAVLAVEEAVKARALFGFAKHGDQFGLDPGTMTNCSEETTGCAISLCGCKAALRRHGDGSRLRVRRLSPQTRRLMPNWSPWTG